MRITYCYDETAKEKNKRAQAKFIRAAAKLVPGFEVEHHFNKGGVAVWGEHFVKISRAGQPVVEAIITLDYTLVRQWDGRNSGHNSYLPEHFQRDPQQFAALVQQLAARPFVRF